MLPPLFTAVLLSLQSLLRPAILAILLWSVVLTLACSILFVGGVTAGLHHLQLVGNYWLSMGLDVVGGLGAGVLAWFLLPILMPSIAALFEDILIRRLHRLHYPSATLQEVPFWPSLWGELKVTLLGLGLNIICLPLYLVPGLNLVTYYTLNGYLLGRSFFMLAGQHFASPQALTPLRQRHRLALILAGALLVALSNIPLIGLFTPVLGLILMVHLSRLFSR